jgi:hypothetical protein
VWTGCHYFHNFPSLVCCTFIVARAARCEKNKWKSFFLLDSLSFCQPRKHRIHFSRGRKLISFVGCFEQIILNCRAKVSPLPRTRPSIFLLSPVEITINKSRTATSSSSSRLLNLRSTKKISQEKDDSSPFLLVSGSA